MNRFALTIAPIFTALALSPHALSAQIPVPGLYVAAAASAPLSSSSSVDAAAPAPASSSAIVSSSAHDAGSVAPFSSVALGVKFGIAGAGFDVATPLTSWLNVRGGASFFSYSTNLVEDGANITGNIKLQNAAAVLDIFPFHNRFRISGGATIYNDTGLNAALLVPGGNSVSFGGTDYISDPAHPITGTAAFKFGNRVAPRVTLGFGNMIKRRGRFGIQSEVGFQYISQPTVKYTISGNGCSSVIGASSGTVYTGCGPVALSSVTQEQNNLQSDLSPLRFFPILSFGFSYKIGH